MPEQTSGPSWTPEDVELVVQVLKERGLGFWRHDAEDVLAALTEAGRLREPGGEEWTVRRHGFTWPASATREDAERDRRVLKGAELMHRWVGPWLPVETTDTPKEKP